MASVKRKKSCKWSRTCSNTFITSCGVSQTHTHTNTLDRQQEQKREASICLILCLHTNHTMSCDTMSNALFDSHLLGSARRAVSRPSHPTPELSRAVQRHGGGIEPLHVSIPRDLQSRRPIRRAHTDTCLDWVAHVCQT